jgi:hypothetical protein
MSYWQERRQKNQVILVTSNHNHVVGHRANRLLDMILIVTLGSLIGFVVVELSQMPEGHVSSYSSGHWTDS